MTCHPVQASVPELGGLTHIVSVTKLPVWWWWFCKATVLLTLERLNTSNSSVTSEVSVPTRHPVMWKTQQSSPARLGGGRGGGFLSSVTSSSEGIGLIPQSVVKCINIPDVQFILDILELRLILIHSCKNQPSK